MIRLGITDEDGMFIVPVNYGYTFTFTDGKPSLTFYIHGAAEGRKARAFASAPGIAFEMDYMHEIIRGDYSCSYSYAYRSIMGNGIIDRLDDIEEKKKGLARLMEHMAPGSEDIIFTGSAGANLRLPDRCKQNLPGRNVFQRKEIERYETNSEYEKISRSHSRPCYDAVCRKSFPPAYCIGGCESAMKPDDSFYRRHSMECTYLNRSCIAGEDTFALD